MPRKPRNTAEAASEGVTTQGPPASTIPQTKRIARKKQPAKQPAHRAGFVAIVGRPNVGKSTLLNALLEFKLAIVSPKPQTTRHSIRGILTGTGYQAVFLDTPGFSPRAADALARRMLRDAAVALADADVVVLVVEPRPPGDIELRLMEALGRRARPALLAINKVDAVPKEAVLPVIATYHQRSAFKEIVPISALTRDGVDLLLNLIIRYLPEGERLYDPEMVTDKPERFLVGELVQEKVFQLYGQEIPYDVAVEIEEFREASPEHGQKDYIRATIYVDKPSQRRILVGSGGQALKKVGTAAREDAEVLLGRPVYLELWVKVQPRWRQDPAFLERIGY